MAHTIRLNENLGVIVVRYRGTTSFAEIRDVLDEVVRVPGFRKGLKLIATFAETDTPLTAADARRLADYADRTDQAWGTTKWIIVAPKDLTFGLASMYSALTDKHEVETRVFRDAGAANNWLGLGIDAAEILKLTPE